MFSEALAKNHHIEVYRYSEKSNRLGYCLYKEEADFYHNRERFISLGKNKQSRKEKEPYLELTFSARKLGKNYSLEEVEMRLKENLPKYHYEHIIDSDKTRLQLLCFVSGVNYETGELDIPVVEISNSVKGQFRHPMGEELQFSYDDFLSLVDDHFNATIYQEDDNEYEIKLHTHVNPLTLESRKYKKLAIKKTDEKPFFLPESGVTPCPHTPSAEEIHHRISSLMADDLKIHRAKKDYEFTQRLIENQHQRQQVFDMDF